MVWTLIEPGVAIIASSLVTIRPLLRAMRVKGFNSTDPSRSYGPSGTASRSNTMRSGANRGAMPGFGPDDVTMVDMEAGDSSKKAGYATSVVPSQATTVTSPNITVTRTLRISEHREAYLASPTSESDRTNTSLSNKSEVFVIEGAASTEQLPIETRSWSSEEDIIHNMEAQSQHSGKVGLGGAR